MKKEYVPPKSHLYSIKFDENIASSLPGGTGGDQISGAMTILFSHSKSPCRDWYTGGVDTAPNSVGYNGSFIEYFMDMQKVNSPIACLQMV